MRVDSEAVFAQRARSPYSLGNRLLRGLWQVVQATLFAWSPRPCHFWRRGLLRLFGAKVAASVHVYPKAIIWAPWNVEIGSGTGIADRAELYSQGRITIGERCVISQNSYLCAATHDYDQPGYPLVIRPIVVGDDCWVAAGAFVHPGVTLANGVVVGACSVVVKDLPAWSVCAGHPCRVLKLRKPYENN